MIVKKINFVDPGITYSVLNTKLTNKSSATSLATGLTGQLQQKTSPTFRM